MDEFEEMHDHQGAALAFLQTFSPQDLAQPAPADMSMPSETDAPAPSKPKYTEDQLKLMPEWIETSKKMFEVMNDGQRFIGSDKQAASYGLDLMSEFNWNMAGPAGIPGESGISVPGFGVQVYNLMSESAGPDAANGFLNMLDIYADTKTEGATIKRAFRGLAADPLTYATPVGSLYSLGAKAMARKTATTGLRNMLMSTAKAAGFVGEKAMTAPGKTGMAAGAGYGMGFEGGLMGVETAAGDQPTLAEAATRLAVSGTVGSAVGGTLGKALVGGATEAAPAIARGIDQAGQAAEARMAERGPITDRVMSGADPMEVIDPALAAAGKLVRPTKENPVTAVPPTETEPGIIAFHGSGADFDQFSLEKIGTGEGAQAYGYGLYFTDSEDIAKFYRDTISRRQDGIPQSVPDAPENIAGELALDINFNKGVFGDTKQLQINSADPDYDFYIQTLDDNAVETTQSGALKTFEFRDGSIISLLNETMPVFNGKALDSVYTSDIQDVFGAEIADVAQRAKDMGIPGTLEELTDDVTTVLSQLGQGLSSKRDMSAAVESLAPSGQGAPSRFKTIYNHFIEPKSTIETTSTVTELGVKKGKMYKVGLEPKPEDMLDYDKSLREQPKFEKVLEPIYAEYGVAKTADIGTLFESIKNQRGIMPKDLSKRLSDAGIPGIKYRAAGYRGSNVSDAAAKQNYVIFDDKAIKILEKYGIVGPVAITALGAAKQEGADNGDT